MQFSARPASGRMRPGVRPEQVNGREETSGGLVLSQRAVEHLLVATDLTQRSDSAIERATELADLLGAQLTLLHVVEEGLPRRVAKHRRSEALALLKEHMRLLSPNADRDISISVRTGTPFLEIAREAIELGSEAIILGRHGRRPSEHQRNETTAARVIRYSDRPVLIVTHQPTGSYRSAIVHAEGSKIPLSAARAAYRLAPRAEPRIVHTHSPISAHCIRPQTTALLRRHRSSVDGLDRMSTLHAAVRECCADLLVLEIGRSGELREPPLGDAVSNLLADPPCDLLVVRDGGESQ